MANIFATQDGSCIIKRQRKTLESGRMEAEARSAVSIEEEGREEADVK